jgi:hypothetical protein
MLLALPHAASIASISAKTAKRRDAKETRKIRQTTALLAFNAQLITPGLYPLGGQKTMTG